MLDIFHPSRQQPSRLCLATHGTERRMTAFIPRHQVLRQALQDVISAHGGGIGGRFQQRGHGSLSLFAQCPGQRIQRYGQVLNDAGVKMPFVRPQRQDITQVGIGFGFDDECAFQRADAPADITHFVQQVADAGGDGERMQAGHDHLCAADQRQFGRLLLDPLGGRVAVHGAFYSSPRIASQLVHAHDDGFGDRVFESHCVLYR